MAKSSKLIKQTTLVVFMVMLVMGFWPGGQAQISCDTVSSNLYPCLSFVVNGGTLDPACCGGFKALVTLAKTNVDRQSICYCLKSLLSNAPNDDEIKNAGSIPGLCGVNLPYTISRDIDCSK
nr:non-specific lipid-transfer protein 1-like [Coffea arabica]